MNGAVVIVCAGSVIIKTAAASEETAKVPSAVKIVSVLFMSMVLFLLGFVVDLGSGFGIRQV